MSRITYYHTVEQRSDEWYKLRCGMLTASEMKKITSLPCSIYNIHPEERAHLYELAAQTVTQYVEPEFVGYDMERGIADELRAKVIYNENVARIEDCGFITREFDGFKLGYSPDALVGSDGQIEVKSRKQRLQFETVKNRRVPGEFMLQIQAGLLVSGREWCDFISYCGGMDMMIIRVLPNERLRPNLLRVCEIFHKHLRETIADFESSKQMQEFKFFPTERVIEKDITLL